MVLLFEKLRKFSMFQNQFDAFCANETFQRISYGVMQSIVPSHFGNESLFGHAFEASLVLSVSRDSLRFAENNEPLPLRIPCGQNSK